MLRWRIVQAVLLALFILAMLALAVSVQEGGALYHLTAITK